MVSISNSRNRDNADRNGHKERRIGFTPFLSTVEGYGVEHGQHESEGSGGFRRKT